MNNHLSKLSIGLVGFVAGVAFLISCGGGESGVSLPINDADAAVPVSQVWSEVIPSGGQSNSGGAPISFSVPSSGMILTDVTSSSTIISDATSAYCYLYLNSQIIYTFTETTGPRLSMGIGLKLNQGDALKVECTNIYFSWYPLYIVAGYM